MKIPSHTYSKKEAVTSSAVSVLCNQTTKFHLTNYGEPYNASVSRKFCALYAGRLYEFWSKIPATFFVKVTDLDLVQAVQNVDLFHTTVLTHCPQTTVCLLRIYTNKYGSNGCQSDAQVLEQFSAVIKNIFSRLFLSF